MDKKFDSEFVEIQTELQKVKEAQRLADIAAQAVYALAQNRKTVTRVDFEVRRIHQDGIPWPPANCL